MCKVGIPCNVIFMYVQAHAPPAGRSLLVIGKASEMRSPEPAPAPSPSIMACDDKCQTQARPLAPSIGLISHPAAVLLYPPPFVTTASPWRPTLERFRLGYPQWIFTFRIA